MRIIKIITIFIAGVYGVSLNAQTLYPMVNGGSISACDGLFQDSGGGTNSYSNNENLVYTICAAGGAIQLNFADIDILPGDILNIYEGTNTSGNLLIALDNNNTNVFAGEYVGIFQATCVTLEFISDGINTGTGWNATILCHVPCQTVNPTITSTPAINPTSRNIDLCAGDSVFLSATGAYPESGTYYTQSDALSTFTWDIDGDGSVEHTGMTWDTIFDPTVGHYIQLFITDTAGCANTILYDFRIRTATEPTYYGIGVANDPVCYLSENQLYTDSTVSDVWSQSYGNVVAGFTALPDGSGNSYSTDVTLSNFGTGQTLNNASDLTEICMSLEHSYLGDLQIEIACPNGQSVTLVAYPNGGGNTFLGEPVDGDATTGYIQGTGYEYCFSSNPTYGTFSDEAANPSTYSYTDNSGTQVTNQDYLPAGSYTPDNSFNGLVGCPLNGSWTITVIDNLSIDNGAIFSWSIDFNQAIFPNQLWGYQPTVAVENWENDPTITSVSGDTINVLATVNGGTQDYTYTVIDNFGCTWDTTISFTVLPSSDPSCKICFKPTMDSIAVACFGDSTGAAIAVRFDTINASPPPYIYTWKDAGFANTIQIDSISTDTSILSGMPAGTYNLIIEDNNQCIDTGIIVITEPELLQSFEVLNNDVKCGGECNGVSTVNVTGGTTPYIYLWTNNGTTATFSGLCEGINRVTITDNHNCIDTVSVSITAPLPIVVTPQNPDTFCYSTTAELYVDVVGGNGGYSYLWNTGAMSDTLRIVLLEDAIFSVIVSDMFNCTGDTLDSITVRSPLRAILPLRDTICNGDSAIVDVLVSGGNSQYTYAWSGGLGNDSLLSAAPINDATYTVTVSDNCGSPEVTAEIKVLVGQYPIFALSPPSKEKGCAPLLATFNLDTIRGGRKYIWDFSDGPIIIQNSKNVSHLYSNPGCYDLTLKVETTYGCVSDTTMYCAVEVYPNPTADFTLTDYNLTTVRSTTTFIDQSSLSEKWDWSFGDGEVSEEEIVQHTYLDSGRYKVILQVETDKGCKDSTSIFLDVTLEPVLYLPNSFTPNGDGKNDIFLSFSNGIYDREFLLSIYNKWGNLIYSTGNPTEGWDGYDASGKLVQEGVYVYHLQYVEVGETEVFKTIGHVTVVKTP